MDRGDVRALGLMSEIVDRANEVPGPADSADSPALLAGTPDPLPGPTVSQTSLHTARVLLSQQNAVGDTRWVLPKRLVLRASRLFTHRLVAAVQAVADGVQTLEITYGQAIRRLTADVNPNGDPLLVRLDRLSSTFQAQLTNTELGAREHVETVAQQLKETALTVATLESAVRSLEARIAADESSAAHDRSELHRARALISRLARGVAAPNPGEGPPITPGAFAAIALDEDTYLEFEQSFRGTRDEIRARQRDALPLVEHLRAEEGPFLDLGCGRGEWLELLRAEGISAYGVDSNAAMVGDAVNAGLDVSCTDALNHLDQVEESTLQGVSAFQFIEHIPLDVLVRMLDGALLALRPGGTLILETPNPTNLVVGAAAFYLDPTHLRPIHPDFLRFLVESRGFVDVEVHFVHPVIETAALLAGGPAGDYEDIRLRRVVSGVEWALFGPQDYILRARRAEVSL